jgi:hypothetical protein
MQAPISKSYIDRLFTDKDLGGIYWAISVVAKDRKLPEEFWLFCRIYEWAPSRSGVWQYFEGLPDEEFRRVSEDLDRCGFTELAEQYRLGQRTWAGPTRASEVDSWLGSHVGEIHDAIFRLIVAKRDHLTNES